MGFFTRALTLPGADQALPGRDQTMPVAAQHFVLGTPMTAPFPDGYETALFGMGCFWGAERRFWQIEGVYCTAVGYAGGITKNPTYEEVCSGGTGHTEVVLVVFDPAIVSFNSLLSCFWESHDPTQGMRQGNDIGTQYRSCVYVTTASQLDAVKASQITFGQALQDAGYPAVTTEIKSDEAFFYAEDYHQQYLAKVPNGYCGLGGTGVCFPREDA
ncbi:MAG: peptide-methionine (S)-S-oxide reductase MsrA [Pseudomonadales bacterium]